MKFLFWQKDGLNWSWLPIMSSRRVFCSFLFFCKVASGFRKNFTLQVPECIFCKILKEMELLSECWRLLVFWCSITEKAMDLCYAVKRSRIFCGDNCVLLYLLFLSDHFMLLNGRLNLFPITDFLFIFDFLSLKSLPFADEDREISSLYKMVLIICLMLTFVSYKIAHNLDERIRLEAPLELLVSQKSEVKFLLVTLSDRSSVQRG